MVNKRKIIVAAIAVALSSSAVFAGQIVGSKYAGIQYAISTYSEDGISEEPNPTALIGRLGVNVTDVFSVEGRLGLGLQDDTVNVFGTDVTMEIDSLIGIYGVGHININRTSSLYGLLGLTRAEATLSAPGFISESNDETGLSFGVGADIGIGNNVALNIEYVQYLNKSDFDFSAIAFGVKFGI